MRKTLAMIAGTTLLMTGVSWAQEPPRQPGSQQPPTTREPTESSRAAMQTGHESADSVLVTWLLVENENEVALARIAQQRATSPDVKQFAQKMIDDHSQMVQKLQQAGASRRTPQDAPRDPQGTDPMPPEPTRPDPNKIDPVKPEPGKSGEAASRQPVDASGVRTGAGLDHHKLIRDLGKKCLESSTKMLQEKQGAEFDRCYMGMQLGAHMKASDTIEVFRTYASAALRPTLDESLKLVQAHLQHAKDLVKRTELASADLRR